MEFTKLSAPSLKDLFVRQVQAKILSGELPIGSSLPPERELARQMQVSRAVINGGIVELARQGFLTVVPRKGAQVADYRRSGTIDTLLAIMEFQGQMLGREETCSLLQVRKALEHLAADQTIANASDAELDQLGAVLDELSQAENETEASEKAYAFHHELMLISGNTILPLLYCSCRGPVTALWAQYYRQYGRETLVRNAERLYTLLRNRDARGAAAWIDSYLEQAISGSRQIHPEY